MLAMGYCVGSSRILNRDLDPRETGTANMYKVFKRRALLSAKVGNPSAFQLGT